MFTPPFSSNNKALAGSKIGTAEAATWGKQLVCENIIMRTLQLPYLCAMNNEGMPATG
jgi:hypothetical protein